MTSRDFPLPISSDADRHTQSPWAVEQEASSLIALWPGDSPPTMTEVIAALGQRCEAPPAKMSDMPPRPGVPWAAAFATSLAEAPLIIWTEAAQPLPERELDDPRASACKWVIGVEAMLSQDKPYEEYIAILSAMAGGLEAVAILDVVTGHWLELEALDDLAHDPPGVPPIESLWVIHSVFDRNRDEGTHWLHTHGLWRCGRPELEMLDVRATKSGVAGRLLNDIARRVLDDADLPIAPEPYSIGPGMDVTLHPWQSLMAQVGKGGHGGPDDRAGEDNPHRGMRAVVCGPKPHGVFRKQWSWPSEATEMLEQDRGVIFHSDRDTDRAAKLARDRWGELATAFAAAQRLKIDGKPAAAFAVKARFCQPGDAEDREHMWIDVREFRGETASGELMNQPLRLTHVRHGQIVTIGRNDVSDWQVFTPAGSFRPSDVPALWRVLDVMKDPVRSKDGALPRRRRSLRGVPRGIVEGTEP